MFFATDMDALIFFLVMLIGLAIVFYRIKRMVTGLIAFLVIAAIFSALGGC